MEQTEPLGLKPRYNIAPSQQIPIIRATETDREMVLARWGLVPHWSKEPKTKYSTITQGSVIMATQWVSCHSRVGGNP